MTTNQINYAKEREQERTNLANEAETARHNQQMEWLRLYELYLSQQQLDETHRSNLAREAEANRSNVARENETNRSNLVNENLTQFRLQTERSEAFTRAEEAQTKILQLRETQHQNQINNKFRFWEDVAGAVLGKSSIFDVYKDYRSLRNAGQYSLFS